MVRQQYKALFVNRLYVTVDRLGAGLFDHDVLSHAERRHHAPRRLHIGMSVRRVPETRKPQLCDLVVGD